MVYPHLDEVIPKKMKISPVPDRLLAAFVDFVLFSPIISLILFQPFKDVERLFYTGPGSTEFLVFILISGVLVFLVTALLQAVCLSQWGATPGKWISKLRVVDIHHPHQKIRLQQAFLRSLVWNLEMMFLMLPFLEVISHPFRRPIHDRVADTMVVTTKSEGDRGPHILETHFIRQVLMVFCLVAFAWTFVYTSHFYKLAQEGLFKREELEEQSYLCDLNLDEEKGSIDRIDSAIAMYLAGQLNDECLANEADFIFWSQHKESMAWAYLAKSVILKFDLKKSKEYQIATCAAPESAEVCELSKSFLEGEVPKNSEFKTAQVLRFQEYFENNELQKAQAELESLAKFSEMQSYVQKKRVMLFWGQGKQEKALGAFANAAGTTKFNELAAWLCHEELDLSCDRAKDSCKKLLETVRGDGSAPMSSFVASAVIRDKECRNTDALPWSFFQEAMENDSSLVSYAKAISKSSDLTEQQREKVLKIAIANSQGYFKDRLVITWLNMLEERGAHTEGEDWLAKNQQSPRILSKIKTPFSDANLRLPANVPKAKGDKR